MLDDKEKLSHLGHTLANQMQSITKNFRLGFGSFVDKNVPPFVQPAPNTYCFSFPLTEHQSPVLLLSFDQSRTAMSHELQRSLCESLRFQTSHESFRERYRIRGKIHLGRHWIIGTGSVTFSTKCVRRPSPEISMHLKVASMPLCKRSFVM